MAVAAVARLDIAERAAAPGLVRDVRRGAAPAGVLPDVADLRFGQYRFTKVPNVFVTLI